MEIKREFYLNQLIERKHNVATDDVTEGMGIACPECYASKVKEEL